MPVVARIARCWKHRRYTLASCADCRAEHAARTTTR